MVDFPHNGEDHQICDTWGRVTRAESRARIAIIANIERKLPAERRAQLQVKRDPVTNAMISSVSLSYAYNLLSSSEKAAMREEIESSSRVQFILPDGKHMFIGEELHVLDRLEAGVEVGPIEESQIARQAGDRAFEAKT